MSERKPNRREFLKAAGAAALGASIGAACKSEAPAPAQSREVREHQRELPKPLESFRHLDNGVLVLTANAYETQRLLESMRQRSQIRHRDAKFRFEDLDGITRATTHVRDFRDRDRRQPRRHDLQRVPVIILEQSQLAERSIQRRLQDEAFSMVQLRGHDSDMRGLYHGAESLMADQSLVVFGGCTSTDTASDLYTPDRPTIADRSVGYTEANTYMLIRLTDSLPVSEDWDDLYQKISAHSDLAELGFVMPGDPNYEREIIEN